jgi:hypothetical protein
MSILNVNQIQPVGSGQTVTISATNIDTGSATVTAGTFSGGVTVTSGNLTGITSVSTSNLTVNGNAYPSAGPLSNRNLIINGAMQVAQRGTSETSVTSNGYYKAPDRFKVAMGSLGTWTVSQSTTAPAGFSNSYKFDCTTADASPTANGNLTLNYKIEGQDLQHLNKGTANAKSITLSFWVRSNKTGTYIIQIEDASNSRSISKSYTINSSNTWEYKTIIYEGDTTGIISNDNTLGMQLYIWLAAGSTFTSGTLATSWETTTNANRAVGQVNLADSTDNEWYITGVQLEVGSVATPFEHRSYGDELARCQRYYYKISGASNDRYFMGLAESSTVFYGVMHAPVTMRTDPTLETSGTASHFRVSYSTDTTCNAVPTLANSTPNTALIGGAIVASGLTANQAAMLGSNSASSYLALTAEL